MTGPKDEELVIYIIYDGLDDRELHLKVEWCIDFC